MNRPCSILRSIEFIDLFSPINHNQLIRILIKEDESENGIAYLGSNCINPISHCFEIFRHRSLFFMQKEQLFIACRRIP